MGLGSGWDWGLDWRWGLGQKLGLKLGLGAGGWGWGWGWSYPSIVTTLLPYYYRLYLLRTISCTKPSNVMTASNRLKRSEA